MRAACFCFINLTRPSVLPVAFRFSQMIIIHKPTAILDKVRQDKVVAMMQEYVRNRGVMMDPNEPLVMRRKRTLIFTTLNDAIAAQADEVYQVEGGRLEKVTYL